MELPCRARGLTCLPSVCTIVVIFCFLNPSFAANMRMKRIVQRRVSTLFPRPRLAKFQLTVSGTREGKPKVFDEELYLSTLTDAFIELREGPEKEKEEVNGLTADFPNKKDGGGEEPTYNSLFDPLTAKSGVGSGTCDDQAEVTTKGCTIKAATSGGLSVLTSSGTRGMKDPRHNCHKMWKGLTRCIFDHPN